MRTPAFVFAYANDRTDDRKYLRNLAAEKRAINDGLRVASDRDRCRVIECSNATVGELLGACQRASRRLRLVHFAGHADGKTLLFETFAGEPSPVGASSIAEFLATLKSIRLVMLNGCSTRQQVEALLHGGIPAVVASTTRITDVAATAFSKYFYQAIGNGETIQHAFTQATAAVKAEVQQGSLDSRAAMRSLMRDVDADQTPTDELLWSIHGPADVLDRPLLGTTAWNGIAMLAAAVLVVAASTVWLTASASDLDKKQSECLEHNIARGCYNAGIIHLDNKRYIEAFQFFHFGCNKKSPLSCAYLGYMYQKGYGRTRDLHAAVTLYEQACQDGEQFACASFGQLLAAGEGISPDIPRARQLFKTACKQGEPLGCDFDGFDWEAWLVEHPPSN